MNNDLMTASDNVDTVKEVTKELNEFSKEFQTAHDACQLKMNKGCKNPRCILTLLKNITELEKEIDSWLAQPDHQIPSGKQSLDIRPDDSISNAGSFTSSRSRARSKTSSIEVQSAQRRELPQNKQR